MEPYNLEYFEISPGHWGGGGGGGGIFCSESENKDTVNRLISTFGANNGMDNDRKEAKLQVIGCSSFN